MPQLEEDLYSWTILALLGFTSGILSMTAPALKGLGGYFFIGGVFGAALSTYFIFCKGYRSVSKTVLLVAASIVAYYSAIFGPLYLVRLSLLPLSGGQQGETSLALIFTGGVLGGFVLLTAVLLIFRSPKTAVLATLLKAAVWSLASGLLGLLAWVLGPSLGKVLWSGLVCSSNLCPAQPRNI